MTNLDENQSRAVAYTAGPLEVVAGPGTGKTRVITEKVVHLTSVEKLAPETILALTFTDKAADGMAGRIRSALALAGIKGRPDVGTIHAFCLRLVREHAARIGFDAEPKLLVGPLYVQFIAENVDELVVENTDLVGKTNAFAARLAEFLSLCHDERLLADDLLARVDAWLATLKPKDRENARKVRDLARSVPILRELQRKRNVVSYGDLITLSVQLLEENEDIRAELAARYAYLLVDEYQDNNRAQSDLVRLLAGSHRRVCVVGDEDQSIYRFRGARAGIMDRFLEEWTDEKGNAPKVVTLEENYRSTRAIIDAGQALIRHNTDRVPGKVLRRGDASSAQGAERVTLALADTEATERAWIVRGITERIRAGRRPGEIAILARSLSHLAILVAELRATGVAVEVVGGGGLFDDPAVREVLAWLKAFDDAEGNEVALHRLLRMQSFGITHEDQRALGRAARREKVPLMTLLQRLRAPDSTLDGLSPSGHERIRGSLRIYERFHEEARPQERPDVTGLVMAILDLTGIGRRLTPNDAEDRRSLAAIGGLLQAATNYQEHFPYPSLHGFVRHLDLREELGHDDTLGEASADLASVKVMTVHQSKGREYPVVILPQLHRYPPQNKREAPRKFLDHATLGDADVAHVHLEEERRVLYVGMTRAMEELLLTTSAANAEGKPVEPSAFMDEILTSAHIDVLRLRETDLAPVAAAQDGYRTRRAQEERLVHLVSRLGSHAEGRDVQATLREAIGLVGGLIADGAEGGAEAVERALKEWGIPVAPQTRYLEPDLPTGLAGRLQLSASSLRTYAECPRKFYYKQVVQIPQAGGFEARLGSAIHKALEDLHRKHRTPTPALFDELVALFEENVAEVGFKSEVEKEQGHERARQVLRLYLQEEAARGTRVLDVEKEFRIPIRVQGGAEDDDVVLTGKIDRVDELPDGRVRVVDYKTGQVKSRQEYLDDPQMPIYAWAVQEEMGREVESVEVIHLKDVKEYKEGPGLERRALPWEDGSKYQLTQERLVQLRADIERIVSRIRAGGFEPAPSERQCGRCDYRLLCGRAWGSDEERAARAAEPKKDI